MRRFSMFLFVLLTAACGFTPLHSTAYHDRLAVDLSSVAVAVNGSSRSNSGTNSLLHPRYSELLKAEIEQGVNPLQTPSEKLFLMTIDFSETDVSLFVNPDGTASRGDLSYQSNYAVKRILDGKTVATGSLARTSSYNTSPTADYASYVSIEDARKRGIIELAQDYKLRLGALLPTLNTPNAVTLAPPPAAAPDTSLQIDHSNETHLTR